MGNLLIILGCLFVGLLIVVKLTEKHGKPMEPEQAAKLSRTAMILISILLIGGILRSCVG